MLVITEPSLVSIYTYIEFVIHIASFLTPVQDDIISSSLSFSRDEMPREVFRPCHFRRFIFFPFCEMPWCHI